MNNLLSTLKDFHETVDKEYYEANKNGSNVLLEKQFEKLAKTIIYKGHIQINHRFDIYVRSVEFYFHVEDAKHDQRYIHDPVMFHRNSVEGEKQYKHPFFKLGHFFLHPFGLDITFEKEKIYRASALIKAFNVVDNCVGAFQDYKDWTSSYLYDYIQFVDESEENPNKDIHIEWIDDKEPCNPTLSAGCPRMGIFKFAIDMNGHQTHDKLTDKDLRPWRFYRAEPYNRLSRLLDARK